MVNRYGLITMLIVRTWNHRWHEYSCNLKFWRVLPTPIPPPLPPTMGSVDVSQAPWFPAIKIADYRRRMALMLAWIPTCRERELITIRTALASIFLKNFLLFVSCASASLSAVANIYCNYVRKVEQENCFFFNESVRKCFLGPGKRLLVTQ